MTDPIDDRLDAEWLAAVEAAPPTCKCSHAKSGHSETTGRCLSLACGCLSHRPREEKARTPQPPVDAPRSPALPELAECGACSGTGNALGSTDPDWKWNYCGACWGLGVIEVQR